MTNPKSPRGKPRTDTTERILKFIKEFPKENRHPPTLGEIAQSFKIKKGSVQYHIKRLKEEGKVTSDPGKFRTLEAVKK